MEALRAIVLAACVVLTLCLIACAHNSAPAPLQAQERGGPSTVALCAPPGVKLRVARTWTHGDRFGFCLMEAVGEQEEVTLCALFDPRTRAFSPAEPPRQVHDSPPVYPRVEKEEDSWFELCRGPRQCKVIKTAGSVHEQFSGGAVSQDGEQVAVVTWEPQEDEEREIKLFAEVFNRSGAAVKSFNLPREDRHACSTPQWLAPGGLAIHGRSCGGFDGITRLFDARRGVLTNVVGRPGSPIDTSGDRPVRGVGNNWAFLDTAGRGVALHNGVSGALVAYVDLGPYYSESSTGSTGMMGETRTGYASVGGLVGVVLGSPTDYSAAYYSGEEQAKPPRQIGRPGTVVIIDGETGKLRHSTALPRCPPKSAPGGGDPAGVILRPKVRFCHLGLPVTTKEVRCTELAATDLRPLIRLRQLTSLALNRKETSDLRPLALLEGLKELELSQTRVSDVRPLARLRLLERLTLDATAVSDLSPLRRLERLRELSISETPVKSLAPLRQLVAMKKLYIDQIKVDAAEIVAAVSNMPALEELFVGNTSIRDLNLVRGLKGLKRLDADNTAVKDLQPLAELTGLEELDLHGTKVADIAPLAALSQLWSLDLSHTEVSDLSPLAGKKLSELDITRTKVTSLLPLLKLKGLRRLKTSVKDPQQLEALKKRFPEVSF